MMTNHPRWHVVPGRLLGRLLAVAMALGLFVAAAGPASAAACRAVLPPSARPYGYSLHRMAKELAQFTSSGNNPAYYPNTPFQVLYADPTTFVNTPDGTGVDASGSNTFVVPRGTPFYVPLQNLDDSPPVLGTFPTTPSEAKKYFFDPAQAGATHYQVVVDGEVTHLGPRYVAGPVTSPPLLDGGGTHMVTLGAFIHPLPPGHHTVTISGSLRGALLLPTFGISFVKESFTYTVNVVRHR